MKKDNRISPVGLKGNEINERMIQLMGIKPINENRSTSVVELTKFGPDGNAYAIVRENHEYYIKLTKKTKNIVAEDFKYIGGLMNKKSEAYPSYAKAIKQLNLKFKSLAEAYGRGGDINVFENDNIITESGNGFGGGFADMPKGGGFTGEGNLEGNAPLYEEDDEDSIEEAEECEECELSEIEQAVEDMGKEKEEECDKPIMEHKLTILKAIENMDAIIDTLTEGKVKKKVYTLK